MISNMECSSASSRRLVDSRRKASITILIFSLVYGFFNLPLVMLFVVQAIESRSGQLFKDAIFHFDMRDPEYYYYTFNYIYTLSTALNSAINPILYLWRMPDCRTTILKCIKTLLRKTPDPTTSVYLSRWSSLIDQNKLLIPKLVCWLASSTEIKTELNLLI